MLAGGRGTRMGGADKGLHIYQGATLAAQALQRLAPQVGSAAISANRNLGAYAALGAPVWPDDLPGYPGPLAGFLAGLAHCDTPYLATVPCDCPFFPTDLVQRLAAALVAESAEMAIAATREKEALQPHPVFCLLQADLGDSLRRFLNAGQRKVGKWMSAHRTAIVAFDDAGAFVNANSAAELALLRPAS